MISYSAELATSTNSTVSFTNMTELSITGQMRASIASDILLGEESTVVNFVSDGSMTWVGDGRFNVSGTLRFDGTERAELGEMSRSTVVLRDGATLTRANSSCKLFFFSIFDEFFCFCFYLFFFEI